MKNNWITLFLSIFFLIVLISTKSHAKIVKLSECYLLDAKPKKKYVSLDKFDDYNKEKDDCGCDSCECDDLIPMLDRPLTKKELKEVNMKPKINDFSKKTKVSGMGGVGGPIDVIRGKKQTPTNEPREENDPNPTQK